MTNEFDLIIVGAGVVGLSLACALANSPLKIAIVEAREFSKTPEKRHPRVSSYNLQSKQFFSDMGVWGEIPSAERSDFQHIEVWDGRGNGNIQFDCVDVAKPALGYIVKNEVFVETLLKKIKAQKNIQLFCPEKARAVNIEDDVVTIELADKKLTAKLIVGADGANSWLRGVLSVPMKQSSYNSFALITNVQTEFSHNKTARQVFLATGPLAFLPLKNSNHCSIVWSTLPDEAKRLSDLPQQNFCNELTEAFQNKLGRVEENLNEMMMFPLQMRHVKNYVSHRVALVGDAAHTLHPLAGQGVNLGIQDAKKLADVIATTLDAGRDIGRLQNLRPYERARKGDNQMMISAMQGFKTLFGAEQPLVKTLRNTGLNLTNASRFLKKQFMVLASS